MNYIKLEINGKEYGAKLGTLFLKNVCDGEKITISELFEKIQSESIFFIPKLIFYAIELNAKRSGKEFDLTLEDVFDWFDTVGVGAKEVVSFFELFNKSMEVHSPNEEGNAKPQKKAVVKK